MPKTLRVWALLVVIIAGAALSVALYVYLAPQSGTATLSEQAQANSGLPVRLIIPKINVDARVEYVGLAQDGAMDTPKVPGDVAWYQPGTSPGEVGDAVIDGHSGWKDGKAAAFDSLYKLHVGDTIYVVDGAGATTTFAVRDVRSYDPTADVSSVFSSNDGKSHLNLITCEGVWDAASKSYSKRLVVFADKE